MAPGSLDRWVKCLPLDLMSGLHFTIYLLKGVGAGGGEWPQGITDPWIQTPLQYDIGTLPIVYFSIPSNLYSRQYTCSSLCNFQLKRFGSFRFHILGTLRPHTVNNPRRIKLPRGQPALLRDRPVRPFCTLQTQSNHQTTKVTGMVPGNTCKRTIHIANQYNCYEIISFGFKPVNFGMVC